MAWRVHLTNQPILMLHILPGKTAVLAAWYRREHVAFYDLASGALLGETTLPTPPAVKRQSEEWQAYIAQLTGPNDRSYLPLVRTSLTTIHTTNDGKMRLYQTGDKDLVLSTDGQETPLEVEEAERFVLVALDRALGFIVAMDEAGKVHLYQQNIRVGAFDLGLDIRPDLLPALAISQGNAAVYVTDGRKILLVDSGGEVLKSMETHYYVGQMACSPGGGMLVTSDLETGVIRVYEGDSLTPTHQRHAIDLLLRATQTQLLAELPPASVAPSALTAYSKGMIAFAMSGVVCMTDVSEMNELPRPQALL